MFLFILSVITVANMFSTSEKVIDKKDNIQIKIGGVK
jgi:hypothetical protein